MTDTDEITFRNYVVAFLDVMGQKKDLEELNCLSLRAENNKVLIEQIKRTYGRVTTVRTLLQDEINETFQCLRTYKIKLNYKIKCFSDAVLIFFPLESDGHEQNIAQVVALITGVGNALCKCWNKGIFIRGGVDLGFSSVMDDPDSDIYGAGLFNAYELESSKAIFPRVVLGDNILNYLNSVKTKFLVYHEMVKVCFKSLIEYDNFYTINPLVYRSDDFEGTFNFALLAVSEAKKKFTGNEKVFPKYKRLEDFLLYCCNNPASEI